MNYRKLLKRWIPTGAIDAVRSLEAQLGHAEWEYMPQGWGYHSEKLKGWNLDSIADMHVEKWDEFCNSIGGPVALVPNNGTSEYSHGDLITHNTFMCFAYACALASAPGKPLRLLDWGGGIGHYGKLAESVLPDTELQYSCYDLPVFCDRGKKVYPEARFFDTSSGALEHHYDLTLISSSLWYDKTWQDTLTKLMAVTDGYLFITRMIFIENTPSYIALQRPHSAGYKTEYLCQIFNKNEIINFVNNGFKLIREVFISNAHSIYKAPEQGNYMGYLFKKE